MMLSSGEQKAWETLRGLDPSNVCKNALVAFDKQYGHYILRSFCTDFSICPSEKVIKSTTSQGEIIIQRYSYFFIHSCLWYLIHAKDIPLTGRLIKPENTRGGDHFFRGSHVLPLDKLSDRYPDNKKEFLKRGKELCANILDYGDASVQLFPFPRIPVILILWLQDEEFPARADLLFDSSCELQLPLDILWSIAMLSILIML